MGASNLACQSVLFHFLALKYFLCSNVHSKANSFEHKGIYTISSLGSLLSIVSYDKMQSYLYFKWLILLRGKCEQVLFRQSLKTVEIKGPLHLNFERSFSSFLSKLKPLIWYMKSVKSIGRLLKRKHSHYCWVRQA